MPDSYTANDHQDQSYQGLIPGAKDSAISRFRVLYRYLKRP